MKQSHTISLLCAIKSNQVAAAYVHAAMGGMNNGQLAILENSANFLSDSYVSTDREILPGGITHYTSVLDSTRTEVTADYEEPFGDLFDKASETAERYAEIAFNMDFYSYTREGAISDILENFREAERYVDSRIGIFI